jgi:hypothetical protein
MSLSITKTTQRHFSAALAIALTSVPLLTGQPSPESGQAPIPEQILTARKVFISNAGLDANSIAVFRRAGDANLPYNRFYAAMKNWGRFEIVGAPSDADLVFETRYIAAVSEWGKATVYDPRLELTILDSKTHFILWTLAEPVDGALRKATFDKNFDKGVANLMAVLKSLIAPTRP